MNPYTEAESLSGNEDAAMSDETAVGFFPFKPSGTPVPGIY
jgi:hypothetical protein